MAGCNSTLPLKGERDAVLRPGCRGGVMPALTAAEHDLVLSETRRRRAAAARAGRAEPPRIVKVQDGERQLLIAVSRSAPLVGYLLRRDVDGRLTCGCHGFAFR